MQQSLLGPGLKPSHSQSPGYPRPSILRPSQGSVGTSVWLSAQEHIWAWHLGWKVGLTYIVLHAMWWNSRQQLSNAEMCGCVWSPVPFLLHLHLCSSKMSSFKEQGTLLVVTMRAVRKKIQHGQYNGSGYTAAHIPDSPQMSSSSSELQFWAYDGYTLPAMSKPQFSHLYNGPCPTAWN